MKIVIETGFENIENIVLVFSKNYFLNLVFSMFFMFFRTKTTENKTCSLCFPDSPYFIKQKTFSKNRKQIGRKFSSAIICIRLIVLTSLEKKKRIDLTIKRNLLLY